MSSASVDKDELKKQLVIELTNAYFEYYRYDRPNDSVEELTAFARDIATNELDELLKADRAALKQELKQQQEYDHWENLEHDFGFSAKEMEGIRKALNQRIGELKQSLEAQIVEVEDAWGGSAKVVPMEAINEVFQDKGDNRE